MLYKIMDYSKNEFERIGTSLKELLPFHSLLCLYFIDSMLGMLHCILDLFINGHR